MVPPKLYGTTQAKFGGELLRGARARLQQAGDLVFVAAFAAAQNFRRCGMRASAFPPSPATVGAGASDETGPSAPERVALLRGEEEEELAGASAPADPILRLDARADAADPETPKRRAGKPLLYREATDFMGRTRRYYSAAEVARHSSADDCWLISHGRVYNVTAFLRLHPAGEMAILRHGGQDSTVDFDFHPSRAQAMWAPFLLGYLEPKDGGGDQSCSVM